MKLYEYAILYHQKLSKSQEQDGVKAQHEILVRPNLILARDEKEVLLRAAREIPGDYTDRLDEVEIAIRPF